MIGVDSFNLNDFFATEAALTFAMIAYNLMSLFRMFVLIEMMQSKGFNRFKHGLSIFNQARSSIQS